MLPAQIRTRRRGERQQLQHAHRCRISRELLVDQRAEGGDIVVVEPRAYLAHRAQPTTFGVPDEPGELFPLGAGQAHQFEALERMHAGSLRSPLQTTRARPYPADVPRFVPRDDDPQLGTVRLDSPVEVLVDEQLGDGMEPDVIVDHDTVARGGPVESADEVGDEVDMPVLLDAVTNARRQVLHVDLVLGGQAFEDRRRTAQAGKDHGDGGGGPNHRACDAPARHGVDDRDGNADDQRGDRDRGRAGTADRARPAHDAGFACGLDRVRQADELDQRFDVRSRAVRGEDDRAQSRALRNPCGGRGDGGHTVAGLDADDRALEPADVVPPGGAGNHVLDVLLDRCRIRLVGLVARVPRCHRLFAHSAGEDAVGSRSRLDLGKRASGLLPDRSDAPVGILREPLRLRVGHDKAPFTVRKQTVTRCNLATAPNKANRRVRAWRGGVRPDAIPRRRLLLPARAAALLG